MVAALFLTSVLVVCLTFIVACGLVLYKHHNSPSYGDLCACCTIVIVITLVLAVFLVGNITQRLDKVTPEEVRKLLGE